VEKADAQGLKARTPILQRRARSEGMAAPSREALLAQLDQLSATTYKSSSNASSMANNPRPFGGTRNCTSVLRQSSMSVDRCVHDLIQEQARATPNAVAIVSGNKKISYGELDDRANQLAHLLRSSGVGPNVPVALHMQRSIDLAVGALGILKARGAYVPLDPSYPAIEFPCSCRIQGLRWWSLNLAWPQNS